MKLYFKKAGEEEIYLGEFAEAEACMEALDKYLDESGYPAYRLYRLVGTRPRLMIDFGSHLDFAWIEGITFEAMVRGFRDFLKTKMEGN